ncbi:MAG: hypothetical protein H8E44_25685 [Planctomycetes bacterium]|nr:hypothetical protein [Planctomycetota bacterium]MBL7038321.1 hypothetical protein [Pirellulaceae bacterium]
MNSLPDVLSRSFVVMVVIAAFVVAARAADAPSADSQPVFSLSDFGPLDSPDQARATFDKAVHELRNTQGGVLAVPAAVWRTVKPQSLQGLVREPEPPAETKRWRHGAGVTVVTADERQAIVAVPPLNGMRIERQLRLAEGDSLPHWGTHPVLTIDNRLVFGSSSYLDWLQEPVAKGSNRRFHVPSVRGLWPGQFLNIHGGPGYGGGVTRAVVKSLGYDADKQMSYLVADSDLDHRAGAILHNKSNTGLIHMLQTSHNNNQTYDVKVIRNQYAHGDTYVYYCDFNYMSNVHSAAGDENGNCFGAFIRSLDNNYQGVVEAVDPTTGRLTFRTGARNVDTLGDSRPLVNRNPDKAITAGKVLIVPAECYSEPVDSGKCRFEGKSYPTRLVKNARTGVSELSVGGLIRGDRDCPWTADIVGRYLAVNEPSERTPKGNLRWYQIRSFKQNDDGTKEIGILRYWWGAKTAGSPTLYRRDNYTWDGHMRPLSYIIAPGAYVNDVSRAVAGGARGGQRTLGLAPYSDQGTRSAFESGDAIEQAIGPDPFKPQALRVWMWEDVPGAFPSAVIDLANHGAASRYSAMTIAGGGSSLEDAAQRQEQKPAWDNVIVLNAAAGVGLNCNADFADAAILFQQPHSEQPIKWRYGHAEGKPPREAVLTVSKETGRLQFQGDGVSTGGPITDVQGISAGPTPARNLRGKNVPVASGATSIHVRFPQPESDGDYAVFLEQSWLTNRAVSDKTSDGFTVTFAAAAPEKAALDWMIVR